jgi:hypothetical protein
MGVKRVKFWNNGLMERWNNVRKAKIFLIKPIFQ